MSWARLVGAGVDAGLVVVVMSGLQIGADFSAWSHHSEPRQSPDLGHCSGRFSPPASATNARREHEVQSNVERGARNLSCLILSAVRD